MRRAFLMLIGVSVASSAQRPPADTATRTTFGGFLDTYYAWDVSRPVTLDRSFAGGAPFTTQPARHNEFNVNLAFVEARLDAPDVRGRVALQVGTSVQSNYAGEPTIGSVSGPALARHVQEAVGGVRVGHELWIDGGIFFSHLGMESWISRDNLTYSRSLVAEYSPYYQSGVKATWTASSRVVAQVALVNGWQNVSETNSGKGLGGRVDWTWGAATVSYYNLLSAEAGNRLRTLNGIGVRAAGGRVSALGQIDVGAQERSSARGGTAWWGGGVVVAALRATAAVTLTTRLESFRDANQVVAQTGMTNGVANPPLRAEGASVGLDVRRRQALWRTELRGFVNDDAVFARTATASRREGGFVVTSLAIAF